MLIGEEESHDVAICGICWAKEDCKGFVRSLSRKGYGDSIAREIKRMETGRGKVLGTGLEIAVEAIEVLFRFRSTCDGCN